MLRVRTEIIEERSHTAVQQSAIALRESLRSLVAALVIMACSPSELAVALMLVILQDVQELPCPFFP